MPEERVPPEHAGRRVRGSRVRCVLLRVHPGWALVRRVRRKEVPVRVPVQHVVAAMPADERNGRLLPWQSCGPEVTVRNAELVAAKLCSALWDVVQCNIEVRQMNAEHSSLL